MRRALALLLLAPAAARADQSIDAQIFKPALDSFGVFSTERARGLDQYDFALRAGVGFASAPLHLAVEHVGTTEDRDEVIESQLTVDVGVAFGLTDWLSLAISVPLQLQPLGAGYGTDGRYRPVDPGDESMFQPGTGFYSVRPDQNLDPSENAPGDPRLGLKLRVFEGGGWAGAIQAVLHAPFGDEDVFAGSAGFTVEPKLIVERRLGGRGFVALNLGARLREGTLASTRQVSEMGFVRNDPTGAPVFRPLLYVGSEAIAALGARFGLGSILALGAEGYVLFPIASAGDAECPDDVCRNGDLTAEALGGLFVTVTPETTLSVAAGAGLVSDAARRDSFRAVASLSWAPTPEGGGGLTADRDGDGLPDREDACPDENEDRDGFQDEDGCPEPDDDLDGIADKADRCPRDPEDKDGTDDADGCPDVDDDGDGVADLNDRCPREKEDVDGFQDADGCAEPDNDGDGILDRDDKCANEPETVNGVDDMDGCPDQSIQGGPHMGADRIELAGERIEFINSRSARLTAASLKTLDAVAAVMKQYPTVRIRIEVGVEQSRGSARRARAGDMRLATDRAAAVQATLLSRGVKAQQVDVAPLGSDRPLDAKRPRDPRLNRRVEFIRVTQ